MGNTHVGAYVAGDDRILIFCGTTHSELDPPNDSSQQELSIALGRESERPKVAELWPM